MTILVINTSDNTKFLLEKCYADTFCVNGLNNAKFNLVNLIFATSIYLLPVITRNLTRIIIYDSWTVHPLLCRPVLSRSC